SAQNKVGKINPKTSHLSMRRECAAPANTRSNCPPCERHIESRSAAKFEFLKFKFCYLVFSQNLHFSFAGFRQVILRRLNCTSRTKPNEINEGRKTMVEPYQL